MPIQQTNRKRNPFLFIYFRTRTEGITRYGTLHQSINNSLLIHLCTKKNDNKHTPNRRTTFWFSYSFLSFNTDSYTSANCNADFSHEYLFSLSSCFPIRESWSI